MFSFGKSARRQRERIADVPAFLDFLESRSLFVAQKCVFEYCVVRSGVNWDKLMREQAFIDAYEASRWDAFAAALDDFVVLFEGLLRRAARGSEVALADSLVRAAGTVLTRYDPPERPDRWADELRNLRDRLARMQLAAPADAETIAKVGGTRIYEGLPLHSDMTRHDRELVTNAVRFNFSNIATDLPRSVDADALVAALLRGADADTAGPAAPGVG